MPRVFIIDDPSPNAFATGNSPEKAAVAVTTGILQRLNREELEGVIGHEISHVRNYDIRLQTIALALSAAIGMLVNFASNWLWWGGGRRRDNDRDSGGNVIVLVISLQKIDDSEPMEAADPNSSALYIGDPFKNKHRLGDLFATHPPIADRIARLEKM